MTALRGTSALITGGGTGIGRATARKFAELGCRVVIVGRRENVLADSARDWSGTPEITPRVCDVSDRDAVEQLFNDLPPIDILVNSHGVNVVNRSMADMRGSDWDNILAVNATGVYNTMAAALPAMRERQSGLIINVNSLAGKRAASIGGVAYAASKFAVTALGTSVGGEERKHRIKVTTVFPGEVNTPLLDQRPEPVTAERRAQILQPDEVADVMAMLATLPPNVHIPELLIKPVGQPFV